MKRLSPDEVAERLAQKSGVAPKPANGRAKRGRENLKPIMSWHDPAVRTQLKLLAVETDATEQKLMQQALNLLFAKYGKPPIA
jgi:antitoxin-like ribbon-helix-helix protein